MIGRTLSHYRILEKIGAGGMGEVYRARDQHLNRDVAIKVLPEGLLADDAARKRFRKEALALSKLNHPNIQTVFDFDSQDGIDFLATEYVPGVTLSDKLTRKGLPEKELLRLGQQLAEGLAAAHEQGIVHRDLKPSNLRVTPDGRLKILDFGVAKLARPLSATATTQSLTQSQTVAGTPVYMAPEQKRGEPVDARTDIYAAGLVLREMATGQRPGEEPVATLSDLSPDLQRIVEKCLEKDPENRYQSTKDLLVDLRRAGAAPARPSQPSPQAPLPQAQPRGAWGKRIVIATLAVVVLAVAGYFGWQQLAPRATPPEGKVMLAVLPFDNLSGDPEQEYFSDGLTEEMIAELGRLQPDRLGVIARTSTMHYKNTDKLVDQIGQELGVDYILEGSVRHAGGRVRITAQLIQVSDQTHLWAENYEREVEDIFAIQSQVARRIAQSLSVELLPGERTELAEARPVDPEAYEHYLRGRYYLAEARAMEPRERRQKAREQFELALEKDPKYAPAYAGLARTYFGQGLSGDLPKKEAYAKAGELARKAIQLDERERDAHWILAQALYRHEGDWVRAEKELQRAIELNPARGHQMYGRYLTVAGRQEEALVQLQRAVELDPVPLGHRVQIAYVHRCAGRFDKAIEQCNKLLELDPGFGTAHLYLSYTYGAMGMYEKAIAEMDKFAERAGENHHYVLQHKGVNYAGLGKREEALQMVEKLKELHRQGFEVAGAIADIYWELGDKERWLEWTERGWRDSPPLWLGCQSQPEVFEKMLAEPRFRELLRRYASSHPFVQARLRQ